MAQSRAARLAPVVEMAEKAEKTAVLRLGHFQGQVRLAESKLADLEAFRLDYQEQWIVRGSSGVSGQWLLGYQGFLAQLGTAIDQQRQSLVLASKQPEQGAGILAAGVCPGRRLAQTGAALHG